MSLQNDARGGREGASNSIEVNFQPTAITTTPTTAPASTPDAVQVSIPGIGAGGTAAVPGLRVVLGGGREAGEFKVPVAPAPRQLHVQQANFNAQLSVSGGLSLASLFSLLNQHFTDFSLTILVCLLY